MISGRGRFWRQPGLERALLEDYCQLVAAGFKDKSGHQPLNLLVIGMRLANFVLSIILAMLVVEQGVFDPPPQILTRDQIIAARKKFDLEEKLNTMRPWDGLNLTGPHAFEKPPKPAKQE